MIIVMCQKYSQLNILNIVGISTTLATQISKQQSVVSNGMLHNCLFLFSIAQHIRMLQKVTTPSVTPMHRSCGYI